MTKSLTVVLTGCASGIGRQLATDLYRLGHRIVATDVNEAAMREWAATHWPDERRAELFAFDVRDAEAWERMLDRAESRFGSIDVMMNVAGYLVARWAHETSVADVGLTIDVNVKGVMFGTNAVVRRMLRQGHGHVVNVASIGGVVPIPGLAVYSASKHAVRGFSVAVAQEVREHGVYVTAVCPGPVATPMLDVQLARDEAALTFSSARALAPEAVSTAIIERVLAERPLELIIPAPHSGQGVMARLVGAWPELGSLVRPVLVRMGKKRQARLRRS